METIKIKHRNMLIQILLCILTFGVYPLYWYYQTAKELNYLNNDRRVHPLLLLILLFIPILNIYSSYKYSELYSQVSSHQLSKWIILLIFFIFSPLAWFLVQRDLNRISLEMSLENEKNARLS